MANLKEVISDIVKHTVVGDIQVARLSHDANNIQVDAIIKDVVVVKGKIHDPVMEINQDLGLGNLSFLKSIVNLPNYKDGGGHVTVGYKEKSPQEVEHLLFKDDEGNTDIYRFMSRMALDSAMPTTPKFKGVEWDVTISPTKQNVSVMSTMATIYGGIEPNFTLAVESGDLICYVVGQQGAFRGKRLLSKNVTGTLKASHRWPLATVLQILNLGMGSSACTMHVSDVGALMISVDSGVGKYDYIILAQSND